MQHIPEPDNRRIFVQVPEYRDRELDRTLRDLADKADHPDQLRVVVLSQRHPCDPPVVLPAKLADQAMVITATTEESRGPNWARHRLQEQFAGEKYSLLIDSHVRFVPGWDTICINVLRDLGKRCSAPVLTTYLPSYVPGLPVDDDAAPLKIYPRARDRGVLTNLIGFPIYDWRHLNSPIVAEYISFHFLFSSSSLTQTVRHDPTIYFFGDEVAFGARAFTHGWDFFHPHRTLGWHAYERSSRVPHWDEHSESAYLHRATLQRLRRLYTRDTHELSPLLGTVRTIAEYEAHIMTQLVAR